MADEARLQLHPDVKTKTMKRGTLYFLAVVGACVALYLANSMGLLDDTTKPKPAPEPEEVAPTRATPLIPEAEAPSGILGKTEEKPSEPEESPEDEPISITVQVPDNGTEQMRRQVEAFRQQRAAAALAALSAPMSVRTVSTAGSVPEANPVSGSGQKSDGMDGLADADPARRAAMDREEFMSRSETDPGLPIIPAFLAMPANSRRERLSPASCSRGSTRICRVRLSDRLLRMFLTAPRAAFC